MKCKLVYSISSSDVQIFEYGMSAHDSATRILKGKWELPLTSLTKMQVKMSWYAYIDSLLNYSTLLCVI